MKKCVHTRAHTRVHADMRAHTETTVRQRLEWDAGVDAVGVCAFLGGRGGAGGGCAGPRQPSWLFDRGRSAEAVGSKAAAAAVIPPSSPCRADRAGDSVPGSVMATALRNGSRGAIAAPWLIRS